MKTKVVSAANIGIGGCLVVFAAGEKNMGLGIVRSADLLKFQIVFIRLTAENILEFSKNSSLALYLLKLALCASCGTIFQINQNVSSASP
jgi:hypothetical protein